MSGSIFISYRRDDTAGEAGRLAEHLARRFGEECVFIDIDGIAPGTNLVEVLTNALKDTKVVLVMIGRQWLTITNAQGERRLDDPNDMVRREVEFCLEHDVTVIPVLVQNTSMPAAGTLPPKIASLAMRQAMAIQHEEFRADADRLADAIAPLLGAAGITRRRWRRPVAVAAGVGSLVVAGLLANHWRDVRHDAALRLSRQTTVDSLVRIADEQRGRVQFEGAISTLDRAVGAEADVSRAKALQEDVAMEWMRELRVPSGQTFTTAMVRPLAVLDRAAPFAKGARQADLLAHLGWSMYLRQRDGDRRVQPLEQYKRALAVDAGNAYANTMMGHNLLSTERGPDARERARSFFRKAVDANRAITFVRQLQFAALRNASSNDSDVEQIRVLDEMRRRGEAAPSKDAHGIWSTYSFALATYTPLNASALVTALPATDHLATLRWAFDAYTKDDEARRRVFRFYVARLHAENGDTAAARDSLIALRKEIANSTGTLLDAVDDALNRLRAPRGRVGRGDS